MTAPAFLSLEDVRDRFGIGKTALQDRMKAIGISPTRSGNRSFLNAAQIETLDRLDAHLKSGRGMTDFDSPYAVVVEEPETAIVPTRSHLLTPPEPTTAVHSVDQLAELEKLLNFLDRAAEQKWQLPTSVLRHLLGSKPTPPVWHRFGFAFKPSGSHGLETAWSISKSD
jgi:hypothetical protein